MYGLAVQETVSQFGNYFLKKSTQYGVALG